MPLYLLKIDKRKWDSIDEDWLKPDLIPADPLGDLRITEGRLSVWHIEDDLSNLDLVTTALAATRQTFDKFEYGLFDQMIPEGLDLNMEITPGNTPMLDANPWHRDLVHLTVDKAAALVKAVFDKLEKHRLFVDEVTARILNAEQAGLLNVEKVNTSLRSRILLKLEST